MPGFSITSGGVSIRFNCYDDLAPATCEAFLDCLPLSVNFLHARVSGQEIWTQDAPKLDIAQENSSVFAEAGEIAIGPVRPQRNKVAGLMGIFYGEGKLVDGSNLFAKVAEEDLELLKELGEKTWRQGAQELRFEKL